MEKVKLSEICEVFSGYAFKTFNEDKKGTPVIKIGNIQAKGNISTYDCVYTEEVPINKYYSKSNDIYIALSGATTGKAGIMPKEGYLINQRVGIVRLKDRNIPITYLYSFLQAKETQILKDALGAAQPNISPKDILNYEIPLPSLEEQKAIAEKLDKVSGLIEKRKTQLEKLDLLIKSRFIEMFGEVGTDTKGWGLKRLGDCCTINPKKGEDKRLHQELMVSFVPMPAVSEKGEIDASETKSYDEVKTGFTYFAEQDVLFAKITPCMENGKGAVAKGLCNGIGFGSTEFHVLRPIEGVSNPYWLYAVTAFKQFRMDAASNMTGSAGQRRVPASFLDAYKLSLPPIEMQNQFATFVKQVNKSKFEIQKSLEKLEILKKSLMQQYFG